MVDPISLPSSNNNPLNTNAREKLYTSLSSLGNFFPGTMLDFHLQPDHQKNFVFFGRNELPLTFQNDLHFPEIIIDSNNQIE